MTTLAADTTALLRCPQCRAADLRVYEDSRLACESCGADFLADPQTGVVAFSAVHAAGAVKNDIQKWWAIFTLRFTRITTAH
mgnify:CR=1 FL=1